MDPLVKLWKVWPGNNIILCDGLLFAGPAPYMNVVTMALISAPVISWYVTCYDWLLANTSPFLPYLTIGMYCLVMVLFIMVTCSDPGIIPRRKIMEAMFSDAKGAELENIVDPYALLEGSRFCDTCKIHRPPRASHCHECGNCVLRFDHHCAVMNTCIGARNYTLFFVFLSALGLLTFLVLEGGLLFTAKQNLTIDKFTKLPSWKEHPVLLLFLLLTAHIVVIASVLISFLLVYHISLLVRGETTKENLRGRSHEFARPTKCADYLRRPDSLFDLRCRVSVNGAGGRGDRERLLP